jgi:RHS repeat-associated protein
VNRSSTRLQIAARAASLALVAALLAPGVLHADALPLYIGDPTANEKPASRIFRSLNEGNVKRSLTLAAEKRWGNDYMHARYYSPNLGRFMSVDPVGGSVGSSQSWNRYTYVLNNPLAFNDPDGERQNPVTGGQGINNTPQRGTFGRIRSYWNPRGGQFGRTRNRPQPHNGLDINAPRGTPVGAAEAGVVTDVGAYKNAGNRVQVTLSDGTKLTYAHLDSASAAAGDRLYEGQQVGSAGTSGNAGAMTPDQEHLHFAVTDPSGNPIDPQAWLNDPSADPPATMAEENILDLTRPNMTEIPEPGPFS